MPLGWPESTVTKVPWVELHFAISHGKLVGQLLNCGGLLIVSYLQLENFIQPHSSPQSSHSPPAGHGRLLPASDDSIISAI